MSIWFKKTLSVENLNSFAKETMNDYIGIEFIEQVFGAFAHPTTQLVHHEVIVVR